MDEKRKNELLQEKLESEVNQAESAVKDCELALERARMALIWTKRKFEDYCCEKAHLTMSKGDWQLYESRKKDTQDVEKKVEKAKTGLEQAKTILYQAQKELQDFLESLDS